MKVKCIETKYDLFEITPDITELIFMREFNEPTLDGVPLWIKKIYFTGNCEFNGSIDFLPVGLEEIYFSGRKINTLYEIMNLPKNLKKLKLSNFNEKLKKNCFPLNLKYLNLSKIFNQIIKHNELPLNLEVLHFTVFSDYDQRIIDKNIFPKTLKKIYFEGKFNQPIKNKIPENVELLYIGMHSRMCHRTNRKKLPKKIQIINNMSISIIYNRNLLEIFNISSLFHIPPEDVPFPKEIYKYKYVY